MGERFALDTSGEVGFPAIIAMTGEPDSIQLTYRWSDLTPFQQGYIEAAFHSAFGGDLQPDGTWKMRVGFSDLAPETLAAMLEDCERFIALYPTQLALKHVQEERGREFWRLRQGRSRSDFPPVALYLGDDGRIYQRPTGERSNG